MTTDTTASVRADVVVDAPPERAFEVFTARMGTWWDPDHHLLDGGNDMVVEPRVGGAISDTDGKGATCTWGHVLAWEPPTRFAFTWEIGPGWTVDPDRARASEVEVRFAPEGDGRTRVELEHRHLDRHGEGWEGLRGAVGSAGGWPGILTRFAGAL